jgi:serine/threonine-protein kinase
MLGPFGDYTLLRMLGQGGMAEVFLARCDRAGDAPKISVLKRVLPHLSRNRLLVELFLNEARIAGRLDSPNIARVFDAGRVAGRDYLTMEFVPGADLARLRDRCNGAPARALGCGAVARLLVDVCQGLQVAHDATTEDGEPLGLVHGDVHPRNVMVTFDGVAKLIDFGVAQSTAAAPDAAARGSYAYTAPEQLRGRPFDRRADVFAVGALAWELLTGRVLFRRSANYLTLRAVVEDDVPPVGDAVEDSAAVDALLARALAKQPGDRYASCAEFAAALSELAAERGWDTSAARLTESLQTLFAPERKLVDEALATTGSSDVEDWLFRLRSDVDISWLLGGP